MFLTFTNNVTPFKMIKIKLLLSNPMIAAILTNEVAVVAVAISHIAFL